MPGRVLVTLALLTASVAAIAVGGSPIAQAASGYEALGAPQRLLDTRPGASTADGQFAGIGVRPAGSTLTLDVAGRVGLPSQAAAVVLNITVTEPIGPGFVTVFPCDQPQPNASNLNHSANQTVPNAVISALGGSGDVCLFTLQQTHLIVDVSGWFPTGSFTALPSPQRLLDTRAGGATADGQFSGTGTQAGGTVFTLPVAGRAGVPAGATAVAVNVTVDNPAGPGFLAVFPCGSSIPNASNLNYGRGTTVANLVISRIGTGGAICLFTPTATEVVVDASGVLPAATFVPLAEPQRLLDTRPGQATADGTFVAMGAQPGGATLQLRTAGRVSIPANASAVVLNVTAVPGSFGFVTVHPRGSALPNASNLNHRPGGVVANAVIARVGRGGDICVFTSGASDVIVDVAGWLTGPPPPTAGGLCPSLTPTDPTTRQQLVARPALHTAIGTDRIAVLACDVTTVQDRILDPAAVAAWANAEVAPWFVEASRGAYNPVFEAHPQGRVSRTSQNSCVFAGDAITGAPFTNVMVYDSTLYGGGLAGPGTIGPFDITVLERSPQQSRRGLFVGGGAPLVDPSVVIHELGHTLHWPHSYIGPSEYDNPIDVMSGSPVDGGLGDLTDFCPAAQPGFFIWCNAQNTLAFNRFASGWIPDTQVAIHRSGMANYTLDRPHGAGVQMVALPDPAAPLSALVIEARPATGRDRFNQRAGVAVHLIDQGSGGFNAISANRRQRQAVGAPETYDHVITPGSSLTLHGVTIEVVGAAGDGYAVRVSGTYRRPGSLIESFGTAATCTSSRTEIVPHCPR